MDSKEFNKKMANVKQLDELREATKAIEFGPKFMEVLKQLTEICEHELKQRHCKDTQVRFQFKDSMYSEYMISLTTENKEIVINVKHVGASDDEVEVRTIRPSDIDNKPYIEFEKDIEFMDSTISSYFNAKQYDNI